MPRTQTPLFLHEEAMLIALRDARGTVELGSMYQYALAGAMLAELLLNRRVSIADDKKKLVDLVSSKPLGDEVLDECLRKVVTAKRRASAQTWVQRFCSLKNLG